MGPVGRLEGRVAAAAEPQLAPVPGPGQVRGLAREQATIGRPVPQDGHGCGELVEVDLSEALQVVGPTLTPGIDSLRGQPAEADQHVDGADDAAFSQDRLGDPRHPVPQARSALRHRPVPPSGCAGR